VGTSAAKEGPEIAESPMLTPQAKRNAIFFLFMIDLNNLMKVGKSGTASELFMGSKPTLPE
jgi:hypothetical protein